MINLDSSRMYDSILMYYKELHPLELDVLKDNKVLNYIMDSDAKIYEGYPLKANHSSNKSIQNWYGELGDTLDIKNLKYDENYCLELDNIFSVYLYDLEVRGEGGRAYKVLVTNDAINYFIVDMREEEFFEVINSEVVLHGHVIGVGGKLEGLYTFYSKTNGYRLANIEYSKRLKKAIVTKGLDEKIKYYAKNKGRALTLEDLEDDKYYLGIERSARTQYNLIYTNIVFLNNGRRYRITESNNRFEEGDELARSYHNERLFGSKVKGLMQLVLDYGEININDFIRKYSGTNRKVVEEYSEGVKFIRVLEHYGLRYGSERKLFSIDLCEVEETLEDKLYIDLEEYIDGDINLLLNNAIDELNQS